MISARPWPSSLPLIAWIDLHPGLGPHGHGERIFACTDKGETHFKASSPAWQKQVWQQGLQAALQEVQGLTTPR
jgi:hypothetical protein